jgi:hypothetical protein
LLKVSREATLHAVVKLGLCPVAVLSETIGHISLRGQPMQAVLVMFRNDGERRSFSIARDMTVIGRRQDCDLMIPLGEISRKHCRIIRDGDSLRLEDLGSSNGTFHNGRRVQEAVLGAGDTIQVGPVSFVLQVDGVPADDEIKPRAAGAMAGGDGDELDDLPQDDLERTPATELDEDATKGLGGADEDELEGLGDESTNISDLDSEIGANLGDDNLEILDADDSTAGDLTLEEKKPKKGRK